MAAIFGLIDFYRPARRSPKKVVKHMARVHGLSLARHLEFYADGWVGLGYLPERFKAGQKHEAVYMNDRFVVMIEGDVLNRHSIAVAARLPEDASRQLSLAQILAHAFEHRGPKIFEELDGEYRLIIWDFVSKTLYLSADRLAFRPMFYCQVGRRVFFGSEVKFIIQALEQSPDISPQAVSDFIHFGYLLENNTFFQDIKRLPAEYYLEVQEEQLQLIRFTEWRFAEAERIILNEEEAIQQLRKVTLQAVSSYSRLGFDHLLLSGGLGSRLVAAALKRLNVPTGTLTFGVTASGEKAVAEKTAQVLGTNHQAGDLEMCYFLDVFRRTVWLSDGLVNGAHGLGLALIPLLKTAPYDLLTGLNPVDLPFRKIELLWWRRKKWDINRYGWLAQRIFTRVYDPDDPYTSAGYLLNVDAGDAVPPRIRLLEFLKAHEIHLMEPVEALQYLVVWVRHRNFNAAISHLLNHFVRVRNPLYAFSFLDAVLKLPAALRSAEKLSLRHVLHDLYPETLAVPWQKTSLPAGTQVWREYLLLSARFLNEQFRFTAREPLAAKKSLLAGLRDHAALRHEVKKLLLDVLVDEWINRKTVQRLYYSSIKRDYPAGELLLRIMTLNLWYQYFVEGKQPFEEFVTSDMETVA